jgi:hypothetical protein
MILFFVISVVNTEYNEEKYKNPAENKINQVEQWQG